MNQEQAGLIMVALMVVALALAAWGWSNRQKRYRPLSSALNWKLPESKPLHSTEALYVATTEAGKPLQRVAVKPLGYRAKASLAVHPEGLVVEIRGSSPLLIPLSSGLTAGRATWTIDRVVEPDGLVMVGWKLGEQDVESYFRIVDSDPEALVSQIENIGKGKR
jgi:hypothetical protein